MKRKQNLKRDLEFLYEIGSLRFIDRTWKQFLPNRQNLTEHHFRVVWIALILARMEKVANTDKILKMALLHDVSESRTGDVNYLQRQYVLRDEEKGIKDILANTVLADELFTLWQEYEKRESIEAKIVKDADNLDVDFEVQEAKAEGNTVIKDWEKIRQVVGEEKLYTKSAKKMWKALQTASPHDWHINGRNRFNSGDWKKFQKK
ncbi:MAG TPA: HD domain-containing protein [Methylomirabilota bacterium]|nr:HD domain-containing protein [Methylomirabilota bacterium]